MKKPMLYRNLCASLLFTALATPSFAGIDILNGSNVFEVQTDLSIGGRTLTLRYDTGLQLEATAFAKAKKLSTAFFIRPSAFGDRWTTNFHNFIVAHPVTHDANVLRGDGRTISFDWQSGKYVPISPGSNDRLEATSGGGYRYFDYKTKTLEVYDASGYIASSVDSVGVMLTYSRTSTANGSTLSVGDSAGRTIAFTYDISGKVIGVTDAASRSIVPTYDSNSNLLSLTNVDGTSVNFLFENPQIAWAITGVINQLGNRVATWTYDNLGRALVRNTPNDYGSLRFSATPSWSDYYVEEEIDYVNRVVFRRHKKPPPPTSVGLIDSSGAVSQIGSTTAGGKAYIQSASQPAGSGCAASSSFNAFDPSGYLVSQDDFNGTRTCFLYSSPGVLSSTVEGLPAATDCSTLQARTAAIPNGARRTTVDWDFTSGLPTKQTYPGVVLTNVYHGRPDAINLGQTANCTTEPALSGGSPVPLLCATRVESVSGSLFNNPVNTNEDPYFGNVSLLLSGDGNPGSYFRDDSYYSMTPSRIDGIPGVTNLQSKFGGGSLNFDASTRKNQSNGAIVYGPHDALKLTGDSTIEFFVYFNTGGTVSRDIVSWGGDPGNSDSKIGIDSAGNIVVQVRDGGGYSNFALTGGNVPLGVWNHVALTRTSTGIWKLYLNGTQTGPTINSTLIASAAYGKFALGSASTALTPSNLNGYIDELRITNGIVRYNANFTPPATPHGRPLNLSPITQKYADTEYPQTILLVNAEDSYGTKTLKDLSPRQATGVLQGSAVISNAKSIDGSSSIYIGGSSTWGDRGYFDGDYTLPGDFTIEYWVNTNNVTSTQTAIGLGSTTGAIQFYITGGRLQTYIAGGPTCTMGYFTNVAAAVTLNQWMHIAHIRKGSKIYSYINGINQGWCTYAGTIGGAFATIGQNNVPALQSFYDGIRITKNVARYNPADYVNFVSPQYPFSTVASTSNSRADVAVNSYTYDSAGRIISSKDRMGRVTTYTRYSATAFASAGVNSPGNTVGDLQSITDPAGNVTVFNSYNPLGQVLMMTDPKGIVTNVTYTPRGQVRSVSTTPPGMTTRTTTYTYDAEGQITRVDAPDGTSTIYVYDPAQRVVGVTDSLGNSVTYTLDAKGNRIGEQLRDPRGVLQRQINRSFDALNRPQQISPQ